MKLVYIRRRLTRSGHALWWAGIADENQQKILLEGERFKIHGISFYFSEWKPFGQGQSRHFCENCLLHTNDMKHRTNTCIMETICPQCAKNHSEKSNQCSTNDEPLCINCDKGMDRHRADSIDCPQYRETMKI